MFFGGVMKDLCNRSIFGAAIVAGIWLAGSGDLRAQQKQQKMTEQDYRQQHDDFYNAQRLNIRFSKVPDVYCRTPGVVAAIDTLKQEEQLVKKAIEEDEYAVDELSYDHEGFSAMTLRKTTTGKEQEVASLHRIAVRLLDARLKLEGLPPCATGYRTVFANGAFLGIYVIKATGSTVVTERFIRTDQITHEFSDSHDPAGVGINIAYAFTPWNNNFVLSPFVSLDYLNNTVNHDFAGGSFLGSTANVSGTAGVKIGPSITPDFWLYGIAGASVLNETLNVNFLPVTSSTNKTVAGGTVGAGFAFRPGFLQNLGRPVSLFAEYHHTWWQDAQFNSPAASPLFNYNFRRADDVVKLGFNVHFEEPPPAPPAPSGIYTKAAASK
jgi:hypothetical protein